MTPAIRRVAGILTLLESFWLLYVGADGPAITVSCPANGCPFPSSYLWASLPLGVILLIIGALALWGASFAFRAGAVFSAIVLALMGYALVVFAGHPYLSDWADYLVVGAILAAAAVVGNVLGTRGRGGIPEQANPMNLPVFG